MPSSIYEGDPDKKIDSTHIEDIVQPAAYDGYNKSYAEDGAHRPVTVAGTMGQDPEQRPDIRWTAWAILFLCAMAQFQNTFFGQVPPSDAPWSRSDAVLYFSLLVSLRLQMPILLPAL